MIAPEMPSEPGITSTSRIDIVPVQEAFSLFTRRSTTTDRPRIQAERSIPAPVSARGELNGHQADVGADRRAGEPRPVTDLHGQGQPGQRRDATEATQPIDRVGEAGRGGHVEDLL